MGVGNRRLLDETSHQSRANPNCSLDSYNPPPFELMARYAPHLKLRTVHTTIAALDSLYITHIGKWTEPSSRCYHLLAPLSRILLVSDGPCASQVSPVPPDYYVYHYVPPRLVIGYAHNPVEPSLSINTRSASTPTDCRSAPAHATLRSQRALILYRL
jgi:hypothetical protein